MPMLAGYMVPHPPIAVHEIGRGEEKKIQPTLDSYDRVARHIAEIKPDTIVLVSPHSVCYGDYFHISPGDGAVGNFARFGVPSLSISVGYDTMLRDRICELSLRDGVAAGTDYERDPYLDHGTLVPLYFIGKRYTDFKLIRIGLSGFSLREHYHLGQLIQEACSSSDERVVFVASGDLAHCQKEAGPYGYKPEGPEYDEKLMEVMGRAAFKELLDFSGVLLDECMECGHRSFCMMGGVFDGVPVRTEILSHEATFGVGYGFGIYEPM